MWTVQSQTGCRAPRQPPSTRHLHLGCLGTTLVYHLSPTLHHRLVWLGLGHSRDKVGSNEQAKHVNALKNYYYYPGIVFASYLLEEACKKPPWDSWDI